VRDDGQYNTGRMEEKERERERERVRMYIVKDII